MTEPRFDLVEVADAGELLTVRRAAFVTEAQLHDNPHLPALTETLEELIEDMQRPDVVTIGAWIGHRLIGSIRVELADTRATLGRFAVAPDMQGKGIGGELVMAILKYLPEQTSEVFIMTAHDQETPIDRSADFGTTEAELTYSYLQRILGQSGQEADGEGQPDDVDPATSEGSATAQ